MKTKAKKPVKRAATCRQSLQVPAVAKNATVEPMATRTYIAYVKGYGYVIADKDLPRVVEAMASACRVNVITGNPVDKCINPYYVAHAQLRAIGIDAP